MGEEEEWATAGRPYGVVRGRGREDGLLTALTKTGIVENKWEGRVTLTSILSQDGRGGGQGLAEGGEAVGGGDFDEVEGVAFEGVGEGCG